MKKFISLLTAFVMSFTVFISATPAGAAETQTAGQSAITNDVSVKGTNSFGNLLSDEITQKTSEQQENNGCNIFSAEVKENEATISFETVMDGTLVVAIYDEAGTQMLASGSKEVTAGETEQTVLIDTENMPQYFYLRAFLVDNATLKPLCTQYESPNYTKEMQDFFAKTVNDFDSEKVLNLDDSESNNFAIFSDETKLIHSDDNVNNVTKADEENEQYAFENADDSLKSLKSGDTFACESENGEILIVKIADIKVNGDNVTVTGEDTSMEDVFDYVKIETNQGTGDAVVDASNLEEGVTYKGMIEDEAEPGQAQSKYATDLNGSKSMSLSFEIIKKKLAGNDDTNATISGSLEFKMEASVKLYISLKKQYLEFKLSPSAEISVSITGTIKSKIELAFMGFSPIPGVIIEVTPSFIVEASASLTLSGNLSAVIGFSVRNGEGLKSLNSAPKFKAEIKVEGSIFIGFSIEPRVKIISDKIASVGLEGRIGALINASLTGGEKEPDKQHLCKKCIDGDISGVMSSSVNASLLKLKKLTWEYNIATKTIKLFDFYYSFETSKYGLKSCPNWVYLVNLTVKDENGKAVSGAAVTDGNELNVKTDKNGEASFYLGKGEHDISAVKDNMSGSSKIEIIDEGIKAEITMKPSEIEPTETTEPTEPTESTEAAETTEIT